MMNFFNCRTFYRMFESTSLSLESILKLAQKLIPKLNMTLELILEEFPYIHLCCQ